jgi:hypothetical protein
LIPEIVDVLESLSNFGRQLHGYNNRLSFGATGIENAKGGKCQNFTFEKREIFSRFSYA